MKLTVWEDVLEIWLNQLDDWITNGVSANDLTLIIEGIVNAGKAIGFRRDLPRYLRIRRARVYPECPEDQLPIERR